MAKIRPESPADGQIRTTGHYSMGDFSDLQLMERASNHTRYKAVLRGSVCTAALKVVTRSTCEVYSKTPAKLQKELRELMRVFQSSPTHPGRRRICGLVDVFVNSDDSSVHMVLENMQLGSLQSLLYPNRHRSGAVAALGPALPERLCVYVLHEVCQAIAFVHNILGTKYFDVRPENILVSASGVVKCVEPVQETRYAAMLPGARCPSPSVTAPDRGAS